MVEARCDDGLLVLRRGRGEIIAAMNGIVISAVALVNQLDASFYCQKRARTCRNVPVNMTRPVDCFSVTVPPSKDRCRSCVRSTMTCLEVADDG